MSFRSRARLPALSLTAALVLTSSAIGRPAFAQTPSRAEVLFNEGLANMRAARYEQACPALSESYKLDPLPGVLFTVAECEAAWGKIATALAHYDEFLRVLTTLAPAQQKKHQERRQITHEKVAALARLAPQLTIVAPPNAPQGMVIKRDGVLLDALTLGVATPVDPGTYLITFEVQGKPPVERRVALGKGQTATVGADVSFADNTPVKPAVSVAPTATNTAVPPAPSSRTLAWVLGGVGLAGVAVGALTGVLTLGKKSTIDSECPERLCTPKGRDAVDSAQTLGLVSTIGFSVGVAGLAASAVLLLTSKSSSPSPSTRGTTWQPLVLGNATEGWAGVRATF